jgi:ribosome-associated translation inhibitor RaiA
MAYPDESYDLRIELDTKRCELSAEEIDRLSERLAPLRKVVHQFPVSDLYITVYHYPRDGRYNVHTALVLTGKTLFTADHDVAVAPAFERCVRKLVKKVQAYKAGMGNEAERHKQEKGTHQGVFPDREPDTALLGQAASNGDYPAFRQATLMYEEPVRKRAGRWAQRYPQVNALIGSRLSLEDIVEEIFLNAFERYPQKPAQVRLGDWLERLIHPSLQAMLENPDAELENVQLARTWREAVSPREGEGDTP